MEELEVFVPGRLCLFGEHSDWAGQYRKTNSNIEKGSCIVMGLDCGIYARVKKNKNLKIRTILSSGEVSELECEMDYKKLFKIAQDGGLFSYVAGVVAYMITNYNIEGLYIDCYKMDLPVKKGLSSSAAICVLTARAFNKIYNLNLSVRGEMEIAYRGENLTPSRCGRMDQGCAYGSKPINMIFDSDNLDIEQIKVKKDIYLVFADLKSKKDTKGILRDLNSAYPFSKSDREERLHSALGIKNLEIIEQAKKAIENGDAKKLGQLMNKAQTLFDSEVAPISEYLTSPKLHEVLKDDKIKEYTYGGKGVGSQGDGSVQFVAKDKMTQKKIIDYLKKEWNLEAYSTIIKKQKLINKAIIPVAGFGTRMYPVSKVLSKPLLPIIDKDGLAKPALLLLIEELDELDIEQIGLIARRDEIDMYKKIFNNLSNENYVKLPDKMKKYDDKLRRIKEKIHYIIQDEQKGFGHAVYQAKRFVNNEPVLLLLGDHLFKSKCDESCIEQLLNCYSSNQQTIISISEIPEEKISNHGIVYGNWKNKKSNELEINTIYEKPTISYAKEYLQTEILSGGKGYFGVFGQYILEKEVFKELEEEINSHQNDNEISLTSSLDKVIKEKGGIGLLVKGEMFDIGLPNEYKNTIINY